MLRYRKKKKSKKRYSPNDKFISIAELKRKGYIVLKAATKRFARKPKRARR